MKFATILPVLMIQLLSCVSIVLGCATYLFAQDAAGVADFSETNRGAAGGGRAFGEAAPMYNGADVDTGIEVPNIEASKFKSEVPKLQPIKGFQNLAGSDDVKNLYKELITKPVPVMFQTMMMVENGAATGFMGSMNAVSNLFSNTVESQRFQLELFDAKLSQNPHKQGYVASVVEAVKDKNKDNWPAALWYASGDKVTENNAQPQGYTKNESETGSSPLDAAKQATSSNGGNNNEVELTKILFSGPAASQNQQVELDELKTEFKDWIGDVKDKKPEGQDPSVQSSAPEFIDPDKEVDITRAGTSRKLRGYEAYVAEQRKEVWKNLNKYLKKFCAVKTSSGYTGGLFEGTRAFPHQKAQKDSQEAWEKLRAEDIQLTENFVDQFFKLLLDDVEDYDELKTNCNKIFKENSKLPDEAKMSEAYNVKDYNNCEGDEPCIPRFIMFSITKAIAESRAVYFYYRLAAVALQRAVSADSSQLWVGRANAVICKAIGKTTNGDNCFVLEVLEDNRQQNRRAFNDFMNRFAMFAQGQGGASVFRPVTNNVPNVQ